MRESAREVYSLGGLRLCRGYSGLSEKRNKNASRGRFSAKSGSFGKVMPVISCDTATCSHIRRRLSLSSSVKSVRSKRRMVLLPLGLCFERMRRTPVSEIGIWGLRCLRAPATSVMAALCFCPRSRNSSYAENTLARRPNSQGFMLSFIFLGLPLGLFILVVLSFKLCNPGAQSPNPLSGVRLLFASILRQFLKSRRKNRPQSLETRFPPLGSHILDTLDPLQTPTGLSPLQ